VFAGEESIEKTGRGRESLIFFLCVCVCVCVCVFGVSEHCGSGQRGVRVCEGERERVLYQHSALISCIFVEEELGYGIIKCFQRHLRRSCPM